MKRRRCRHECATCTGQIPPPRTGAGSTTTAGAGPPRVLDATTAWTPPLDPITPNGQRANGTDALGDSYGDLLMVLAIAGSFGFILAIEALSFCVFMGWGR